MSRGWYAVTEVKGGAFWAAWWTGEPSAKPWRSADATGLTPTRFGDDSLLFAFAGADAERAIREARGRGTFVLQAHQNFPRAAMREASGKAPNYRPHRPTPAPRRRATDARADSEARWRDFEEACRALADRLRQPASEAAFAALGLPSIASEHDIKRSFCRLVHEHHPDVGGKGGDLAALVKAKDTALAHVATTVRG